jgi:hypothetical protein
MGGFGSGFQGTAKATTRERHALRVKDWGNLPPGARGGLDYHARRAGLGGCPCARGSGRPGADLHAPERHPPATVHHHRARPLSVRRFASMVPVSLVRAALWGALPRARRVLLSGLRGAELPQHARNPPIPERFTKPTGYGRGSAGLRVSRSAMAPSPRGCTGGTSGDWWRNMTDTRTPSRRATGHDWKRAHERLMRQVAP